MLKNLKKLRTANGISQQKLANILGVSQQSINKYENHDVEPDIATLTAIADYFQVTVDDLIGRQCIDEPTLSPDEGQLIRIYRALNHEQKECVRSVAAHISASNK